MFSAILKYHGDGVTPDAAFADPANGWQFPNAVEPVVTPEMATYEHKTKVFLRSFTHPLSGLANIHFTGTFENCGPNAGEIDQPLSDAELDVLGDDDTHRDPSA